MSQREAIDVTEGDIDSTEEDWRDDLLEEEVILDAYLKSEGIWSSRFNVCFVLFSVLISFCVYMWMFHSNEDYFDSNEKIISFIDSVSSLSGAMVAYFVTILGFFITGFSIFATVTDKEVFVVLGGHYRKDSKISSLKRMFFNFINFFIVHLVLMFLSMVFMVFSSLKPAVDIFGESYVKICSVYYCLVPLFISLSIVKIKSFLWNIYDSMRLGIVFYDDEP
ncbi:hypothetical protein [Thalassospira xiamenensis]|uniref:Uncharacterized protein n=1 Tax=Thalassospira xiamenensis TaxID=220697 RepID=A0A367XE20_9PROT|nr:hypothetical protein [Thalassospira xiamenensis]KZB54924.1 hypothetical protein AUP41_17840 [Thalassospira xiamenensis]RCK51874.1 hypothetical protein TH44_05500 [Thalassospira xiamenensis]